MTTTEAITFSEIQVGDRIIIANPSHRRVAMVVELAHHYPKSTVVSGDIIMIDRPNVRTRRRHLGAITARADIQRVTA